VDRVTAQSRALVVRVARHYFLKEEIMQVEASHILVPSLEQATALRQQINEGSEFSALAREHSSCPSKASGGSLGKFGRGMMVPQFEQATFDLAIGAVSEPVQTQFGWHIIHRTG